MTEETPEQIDTDLYLIDPSDIDLKNCRVSFMMNISNVDSLAEALDLVAAGIGHYGLSAFHLVATNTDTNEAWFVHDGLAQPAEDEDDEDDEEDKDEEDEGEGEES